MCIIARQSTNSQALALRPTFADAEKLIASIQYTLEAHPDMGDDVEDDGAAAVRDVM